MKPFRNSPTEQQKISLQKLDQQFKNVTQIIDRVKEYKTSADGKRTFQIQEVRLLQILQNSCDLVLSKAEQKNIVLHTQFIMSDLFVQVDPVLFTNAVLGNILSNAIKFTANGGAIHFSAIEKESHIEILISDSGIGIPQKILKHIFDMNTPTNRPGTNGEIGTGYGLPLAKIYVDKFNGQIQMSSVEQSDDSKNHGTQIKISIPKIKT